MSKVDQLGVPYALMNAPVSVADVIAMFTRKTLPTDSKLQQHIDKLNIPLLKELHDVLMKLSTDSKVPAMECHRWIEIFFEGKNICSFQKIKQEGMHTITSKETVEKWIAYFENISLEKLRELGPFAVMGVWNLINWELKCSFSQQKYDSVYSKSDDPVDWIIQSKIKPEVFDSVFPFWSKEIFRRNAEIVEVYVRNSMFQPIN